jgi:peptide chain release factor subunit 1
VAAITEAAIRELAAVRGKKAPITSIYLDVDGRRLSRPGDVEAELDPLLRSARRRANGDQSVQKDLHRVAAFVRGGLDRSRTRGLAFFSCSADDLWHVIELPVPVRSRAVINHAPAVGQLEAVVQDHEAIGVLLADRQRARLFVFELGELVERSELIDELPRDIDVRGERERGTTEAHVDELAQQHLRHAAAAAFSLWKAHRFPHLALGGPDPVAAELERLLHPYLRDRRCGRIHVPVSADLGEVRAAAEAVEDEVERRRQARLVDRLRQEVGAGRRGVSGLGESLAALNDHRAERLIVSKGYSDEGFRCPTSGGLFARGPLSPVTGQRMERIDDIVEEAIEEALTQDVPVTICVGNADLDVLGRIGALLRY